MHSLRIENLNQTLRFLNRNEEFLPDCELIVVFQDEAIPFESTNFSNVRTISMDMDTYNKPKMCNAGVAAATSPVVVLLDSDRVLPSSYFTRYCQQIRSNEAISTHIMNVCKKSYTDEEIISGAIETRPDNKSMNNQMRQKNAFSGNTILNRQDYINCGGMDESFVGYGFADTDMVHNFQHHGNRIRFTQEHELHLYHQRHILVKGEVILFDGKFRAISLRNALRYCDKWNLMPSPAVCELFRTVRSTQKDNPVFQESVELFRKFKLY